MNEKNILIVCTGNICRSPLIASILADKIDTLVTSKKFSISSAGTFANNFDPASEQSIYAAKMLRLDISNHKARKLTQDIVDNSDLILCATRNHKDYILSNFLNVANKCHTISECTSNKLDIPDPYGEDVQAYIKIANFIVNESQNIINFIKNFFTVISIGCDHNGYQLSQKIITDLDKYSFLQHLPSSSETRVDYPEYAWEVSKDIFSHKADFGILVCKSGIGMSIAANKFHNIRAALCSDIVSAKLARSHNDANIICIGSEFVNLSECLKIIETFISTDFQGGHHINRLEKISNFEKNHYNIT